MLEQRDLKQDLIAIGLFGVVLFLGLSLLSYDPADPVVPPLEPLGWLHVSDPLVSPLNAAPENACGRWGSWLADACFSGFGYAAYLGLLVLGAADVALLRRRPIDSPWLRAIGFLVTLLGSATLLGLLIPEWSPGPIIGSGGYLGALGSGALRMHFATLGAVVLAASVSICGLLLLTDYELIRFARWTASRAFGVAAIAAPAAGTLLKHRLRRSRAADDETSEEDEEGGASLAGASSGPSVRISGRAASPTGKSGGRDDLSDAIAAWGRGESPGASSDDDEEEAEDEELDDEADDEAEASDDVDSEEEETAEAEAPQVAGPMVRKGTDRAAAKKGSGAKEPAFKVGGKGKKKEEAAVSDEIIAQLDQAARVDGIDDYSLPDIELLLPREEISYDTQEVEVRRKAKQIEKCFAEFGFNVKVVEIETGPVIAQYEIQLEAGLRLSKITGLADDLAIALRVPSVRIVAPIPGKNTVGIEVPNETRQIVRLREVMEESQSNVQKMKIPLFLGKDVSGNALVVDLASLPHLLIAGRTGTGKSVCLNAIISSILMTRRPDEVRMLMIDPKMVELSGYGRLPHLMHPVVTDMKKAEAILAWAVEKMEERYALLARAGVRHIVSYNQLGEEELMERLDPDNAEERAAIPLNLPFIVIVADEMADLMMTAGKEVEQHIIRLAQKSRAVGIHLILATQKPTVDVITGLIKSNLPARLAFQVASRTDSRVVLDEMGADKLLGNGDMLFLWPGTSTLLRGQGTYLSDDEIESITESVSKHGQNFVHELVNLKVEKPGEETTGTDRFKKRDELYESAIDCIVREQRGSVSLLQRTLGIGYGRAARLIDFMCEDGIVGPYNGSQAREILLTLDEWERMQAAGGDAPAPAATNSGSGGGAASGSGAAKRNRIVMEAEEADDEEEDEETDAFADEDSDDEELPEETVDEAEDEDEASEEEEEYDEEEEASDEDESAEDEEDEVEAEASDDEADEEAPAPGSRLGATRFRPSRN
ncbi:MAG TPA: DNA translocase FtsK [Pirellulaceae bacterium]|nr:DNA translocase FtsK [Pirellulaceae bacterium]